MYALRPKRQHWAVDPEQLNQVTRLGFPVIPDFGATIHSVTGLEFDHEILDLKDWTSKPGLDEMLMGYIGPTRIMGATCEGSCSVQPCFLFASMNAKYHQVKQAACTLLYVYI